MCGRAVISFETSNACCFDDLIGSLCFSKGVARLYILLYNERKSGKEVNTHKRPNKRVNRRKREKRFLMKLAPAAGSLFSSGSPSFHSRRFFSLFIISKDFRN